MMTTEQLLEKVRVKQARKDRLAKSVERAVALTWFLMAVAIALTVAYGVISILRILYNA